MEYFEIKGEDGHFKVMLDEVFGFQKKTDYYGGYDTQSIIEIKSQSYNVKGTLWTTTGEIYDFYKNLEKCYQNLKGTAIYNTYEHQLELKITFDELGHIKIIGEYSEEPHLLTKLIFEINSDQTYVNSSLIELKKIFEKYGNNKGVRE